MEVERNLRQKNVSFKLREYLLFYETPYMFSISVFTRLKLNNVYYPANIKTDGGYTEAQLALLVGWGIIIIF